MKQRSLSLLLSCCLASLALACRSQPPAAGAPCICGTPEADIEGCAHSSCVAGKTNAENPDCVCGTLSIPK